MKDIVVTARIDGPTHQSLRKLAKRDDRSISYLLRKAAEQFVKANSKGRGSPQTDHGRR